jgi:hypothetical protein
MISEASVNFLVAAVAIQFALCLAVASADVYRSSRARTDEITHVRSTFLFCALCIFGSLLPLIFSDVDDVIVVSSWIFCFASLVVFLYFLYQLFVHQINLKYKLVSYLLLPVGLLLIIALFLNALLLRDITLYKSIVFFATCIALIRCFLVVEATFVKID